LLEKTDTRLQHHFYFFLKKAAGHTPKIKASASYISEADLEVTSCFSEMKRRSCCLADEYVKPLILF
jgi:hypothetical protein